MREIKFRCWDKVGKEMFFSYPNRWSEKTSKETDLMTMDLEQFVVGLNGSLYILDECGRYDTFDESEYVLMQSIGIKDKNGAEIYVGDIIRSNFTYPRSGTVHEVIECHSGFGVKIGEGTTQYFDAREELEVIGNVYESPELLNEAR